MDDVITRWECPECGWWPLPHDVMTTTCGIAHDPVRLVRRRFIAEDDLHPMHADTWRHSMSGGMFTVMTVCGHHDPPHVTGYWHDSEGPNPCAHASFPLPRFLSGFEFVANSEDDA